MAQDATRQRPPPARARFAPKLRRSHHVPASQRRPTVFDSNAPVEGKKHDPDPVCKTDLAKVLAFIRSHESYTPPSEKVPVGGKWPKFDDISRYGISTAKEDKLWQLEAERLLRAVSDFDETLAFESPLSKWPINRDEFENLSELGNQALHCLNICSHDNELLLFESMRDLFKPEAYTMARNILANCFDPIGDSGGNRRGHSAGREHPEDLSIHGKTSEVFCAFVDYATAVVARFSLQGIPTEFWHTRALAGLVKTSAKMKYLFSDLEKFALQSLEDGQDVLAKDEVMDALGGKGPFLDIIGPDGRPFQSRSKENGRQEVSDSSDIHRLLGQEVKGSSVYFSEMALVATWTMEAVRGIFFFFQSSILSGYSVDAFDICGLIYQTGLNGMPTLVFQDRDGELVGSSSRELVRLSYPGFKMLLQAAEKLNAEQAHPTTENVTRPPRTPNDEVGALLVLEFDEEEESVEKASCERAFRNPLFVSLWTMGDLASVLVPLLCAQPMTTKSLVWAMEIVTGISSVTHTINFNALQGPKYTVFASLRTSAYERDVKPTFEDSDARPLSRSLIAQNRLHTFNHRPGSDTNAWEGLPLVERQNAMQESAKKRHELETMFRSWVIEEKTIVVKRELFVITVLIGCGILVIGGIMVGVFLGQRLTGVDPFNITVFVWVLAGFIILVAKSLQVSEWPWRDFLRGRVPCRSVSELQTVTGVDPQDIIEYLLSKELWTILVTKGPFNRPFVRQSNDGGDGFSIDVKIELRTLVASGIIIVKIVGRQGPALVCMDLRRGAPGRVRIGHADRAKDDEFVLGSFEMLEAFDEGQDVPLLRVVGNWTRILGLYHKPYKLFR